MFGSNSNKPTTRLRELKGSDYEIAKGQPDIIGWDVRDGHGLKFASVKDLIFDIRAKKVRYLVINVLDTKELDLEKRTILVPIGMAELDPSDDDVILPQVTPFQLRALPSYRKENLGAKVERDISMVFGRTVTSSTNTEDDVDEKFYDHDYFNEKNMYRRRNKISDRQNPSEEQSLRKDAELGVPVKGNYPDPTEERIYNPDGTERVETDEEYYARTGRRRRPF